MKIVTVDRPPGPSVTIPSLERITLKKQMVMKVYVKGELVGEYYE